MLDFLRKYLLHCSIALLVIVYTVGIVLICNASGDKSIIELTPITLLLTNLVLFINHNSWSKRIVFSLVAIFILGFGIEVIGVNTGFPFGEYSYSTILGLQFWSTPVMIGINWLMLVYAGVLTIHPYIQNIWLKSLITGLLLLLLDVFIEPVAISWNMWTWKTSDVPIQNYLAWGIVAILLSLMLGFQLRSTHTNKMAPIILLLQFIFFVILGLCG